MGTHSSTLAWKIPWTVEPGRLQSMGSLRVRHDWATAVSLFTFMHWRRKWPPTPVFLPGESQGLGSLVGCRLQSYTESDETEVNQQQQQGAQMIFSTMYPPPSIHTTHPYSCQSSLLILHTCSVLFARKTFLLSHTCQELTHLNQALLCCIVTFEMTTRFKVCSLH